MQMSISTFGRAKPDIIGRLLQITHNRNLQQGYGFVLKCIRLLRKECRPWEHHSFGLIFLLGGQMEQVDLIGCRGGEDPSEC